ncbi:phosphoribosyltransferase [Richelia sinica FACHB-800]|uniref:Phosphoribosyltransferase n=1 Tax=Richelia sinica FACHB-800 TaxID=1357546 RepID=A0A975T7G4_9NOST|nr:phosphoribosyltransferase [Richelia sinica]MBD2663569.1 phosphoribosyltransferase [Richelia sinica FACHB-800]QXE22877.1 phosphoribosyltransferase [Richelia sinica FACHB-800]
MRKRFRNRTEAGLMLASHLQAYSQCKNLLVLALPRGGVPVGYEVAQALNAPLDVCLVRKLGVPGHEELAMGAIAEGGRFDLTSQIVCVLNYDVINGWGIDQETIDKVIEQELEELHRRDRAYRGDRPPVNVHGQTIILIDDGIATGSTIRAAIAILRQQQPSKIIVAVPIAPPSTYKQLQTEVDEVISLITPEPMSAIGVWYEDFSQTTDAEVRQLLKTA